MAGDNKESVLGKIFVAVVVALLAGGSSPWWVDKVFPSDKTSTSPPKLDSQPSQKASITASSIPQSPTPASSTNEDREIWRCDTGNAKGVRYWVDQLDLDADNFEVRIFENAKGEDQGNYIGTVPIKVTEKSTGTVKGNGRLGSRTIDVDASFGRGINFSVVDSAAGQSIPGAESCSRNTDVASSKRRESIYFCLELAKRVRGSFTGLDGRACQSDPDNHIQELKELQSQNTGDGQR